MSEKHRNYSRQYFRNKRSTVLNAYGDRCECCGETRRAFLTIDHINNDGRAHGESLRKYGKSSWKSKQGYARVSSSIAVWNDIIKRGFPKDEFRCLCYNCNVGRHRNPDNPGICPHEIERGVIVSVPLTIKREILESQLEIPIA